MQQKKGNLIVVKFLSMKCFRIAQSDFCYQKQNGCSWKTEGHQMIGLLGRKSEVQWPLIRSQHVIQFLCTFKDDILWLTFWLTFSETKVKAANIGQMIISLIIVI